MQEIKGKVSRVIYKNEDNDWAVVLCEDTKSSAIITGTIPGARCNMEIVAKGKWVNHPQYGEQLKAESVIETVPATVAGMEGYLGSGVIKGIGPKMAKRIVDEFGKNTFKVIEKTPQKLTKIEGIGRKRVKIITDSYKKQTDLRELYVVLQGYDVSISFANRIYKEYGDKSLLILKTDPYKIADDVWGFGFKTADQIALKLGVKKDSSSRIVSGIQYVLHQAAKNNGHCFLYQEQILKEAKEILDIEEKAITKELEKSVKGKTIIREDDKIYLLIYYYTENKVANNLIRIRDKKKKPACRIVDTGISYDEIQEKAIKMALNSGCCYITGGPGTGKTTITNAIVKSFTSAGQVVLLAAPTGRAAKRLSEMTGHDAKTIHRTLEVDNEGHFKRNEENPLEGDVIIVDECSMLDLMLTNYLLSAVPNNMRLIMVGDADQLPSVGAGNVFADIMASGKIKGTRLTKIYRQKQGNRIITNAHNINNGVMPECDNQDGYYSFLAKTDEEAAELILKFYMEYIPKKFGRDKDVQVLAPMKKGPCGVFRLNNLIQEAVNHGEGGLAAGGYHIREKDRVMQMRNNYDLGVYNGDIGTVKKIDEENGIALIAIDGRIIEYGNSAIEDLSLAYATTIHKSQGSEYDIVVMPMLNSHYIMLNRNLLYTAITRAKDTFIMIGSSKAVGIAVSKKDARIRQTTLSAKI